jgi:hypothetical protein
VASQLTSSSPQSVISPSTTAPVLQAALQGGVQHQHSWKRRPSNEPRTKEPQAKKLKTSHDLSTDPYAFDDEDSKADSTSNGPVEFARFGQSSKTNSPVPSPGPNSSSAAATAYKFKSALLSRTSGEPPKLSSKGVPLAFEVISGVFLEACDRFVEDLNSKPVAVSLRASMESFKAAQATRAGQKAERKAEKDQQKADAAERKAEREERKEKERLGLLPPSPEKSPKKRGKKGQKEGSSEEVVANQINLKEEHKENDPDHKEESPVSGHEVRSSVASNNNNNAAVKEECKPKKGGTWALPIVPKMPQKQPVDKRKGLATLPNLPSAKVKKKESSSATGSGISEGHNGQSSTEAGKGGLANVWFQAFGAKPVSVNSKAIKQEASSVTADIGDKPKDVKVGAKKTYLDIPPEKRRRPRPSFGGLIHFAPDWERAVQKHHEKSRMPTSLVKNIEVTDLSLQTNLSS